jgi:hypothetical protein
VDVDELRRVVIDDGRVRDLRLEVEFGLVVHEHRSYL